MGYKVYEEEFKKTIVQLYENGKKISELEEVTGKTAEEVIQAGD